MNRCKHARKPVLSNLVFCAFIVILSILTLGTTPASTAIRLSVVGKQRQVELNMAAASIADKEAAHASAIFVVPTLLTPLFIEPEAVAYNPEKRIFVLKDMSAESIPDGLIPHTVRQDPELLSSVLGRAISLQAMLSSNVKVIVLYVNLSRPKVGNPHEYVDDKRVRRVQRRFAENLQFIQISAEVYRKYKDQVPSASYVYTSDGRDKVIAINSSQIQQVKTTKSWGVYTGREAQTQISALNELLKSVGVEGSQFKL